jgi:hypothetical protein
MASAVAVGDEGIRERTHFRWPMWVAALLVLIGVHTILFGYMQNLVDLRPCIGYSPDPLMKLIAIDERWQFVTITLYLWVAVGVLLVIIYQAVRGLHYPLMLLMMASSITSTIRIVTLYLLPLCNPLVTPGGAPPLTASATVNLYFVQFPFRPFAVNDLVFSGHIGIYMLLLYVTPHWSTKVRIALAAFIVLMMYGLIATREHYTIDLLLAIPCSFFAYSIARQLLKQSSRIGFTGAVAP